MARVGTLALKRLNVCVFVCVCVYGPFGGHSGNSMRSSCARSHHVATISFHNVKQFSPQGSTIFTEE